MMHRNEILLTRYWRAVKSTASEAPRGSQHKLISPVIFLFKYALFQWAYSSYGTVHHDLLNATMTLNDNTQLGYTNRFREEKNSTG